MPALDRLVIDDGDRLLVDAKNSVHAEQGNYDQWLLWARRTQRQRQEFAKRSGHNNNSTSELCLMKEFVDPFVEQHMKWVVVDASASTLLAANGDHAGGVPAVIETQQQQQQQNNVASCTEEKNDFLATKQGRDQYTTTDASSACSSTKVTFLSETDDESSYFHTSRRSFASSTQPNQQPQQGNGIVYPPVESEPDFAVTHSMILQQHAILKEIDTKRGEQQESSSSSPAVRVQRENGRYVKLVPNSRIMQAMERGESIRVLACSGCRRELIVTPDVKLVFCPHCACFTKFHGDR